MIRLIRSVNCRVFRLTSTARSLALICLVATIVPISTSAAQTEPADKAIERGIEFLLSQQKESGSISDTGHETTLTSLSVMAMASVGLLPNSDNQRSEKVKQALDFVLRQDRQDKMGYFGSADGSRMYGHGITTADVN